MRMAIPQEPLALEDVLARWPTIRQSFAAGYDDCPLSAFFSLKYAQGWSTTPQARGTIFHRTAAEILRTMQRNGTRTIPRREALEILLEQCYQRDVPAEEIVRVPMRQMKEMRMAVDKFAKDNEFSTDRIVDVERKLEARLAYPHPDGGHVERILTGTLDCLLFEPEDEAIVIDWKDTWALPPQPKEAEPEGFDDEELKGLSFHGYFQQRWYGWLVMRNYRNVNKVTLREFYPRKTKVRRATLHRHQLPDVEEELGILIATIDAALMQGPPNLKPDEDGFVDFDALEWWKPQPGKHCAFCNRPTACPIEEDVRVANGGAVNERTAPTWAARYQVAKRIETMAREGLKGLLDMGGPPIPIRWSKGRQVLGWFTIKGGGRRFGAYTPQESDRGAHPDIDVQLMDAMKEATARARRERGVQPRRRRTKRKVTT